MSKRRRSNSGRPGRPRTDREALSAVGVGSYDGAPVFEGFSVEPVSHPLAGEHVMLGIGHPGSMPVAYLALCPVDGVRQLATDVIDAAAPLAERHGAHREGRSP